MQTVYGLRINARPPNKHDAKRPLPPELQVRHEPSREEKHLRYERHKAEGKIDGRAKSFSKIKDLDYYFLMHTGSRKLFELADPKDSVHYTVERLQGAVWVPILIVFGIKEAMMFRNSLNRYHKATHRVRPV